MRKLTILFATLTLCVGMWAQESSQPDTVRIFNDILIMYEVHNPQTWEVEGWSYNSHTEDGLYTFITTNQLNKFGTFSIADGTIDTLNQWNVVKFATRYDTLRTTFVEGQMIVAEINDSIVLNGEFKGENGKVYLFHCTHLTEALNTDTDIDIEQNFEYYQMFSYVENGVASIELESAEITAFLELYVDSKATDIPVGTYQLSNTQETGTARISTGMEAPDPQLCYAATMDTLAGIVRDFWYMTEGSITITYDEYGKMNVEVNTKNSYNRNCHLTVTHHYVEPIDTIVIAENVDFAMGVYPLKQHFYMCQIYEQASPLAVFLIRTNDISGNFSKEICLPGSFIKTPDGYYRSIVDFEQCVVEKEGKDMQMEARFVANDSILYIIRGTGYEGAIIGDAKIDYEGHFLGEKMAPPTFFGDSCHFNIGNKDDLLNFCIVIKRDEQGNFLPGEYSEILRGGSYDMEGERLPSYIDRTGGLSWYIQSGTLTVNADGSMAFEGLNSYDKKVVFTISAKGTDLINVNENVNVNKFLHNGQLLIRKDGKTYNAVGVEL